MAEPTVSEEWRVVADFPDYEVSNLGRIRRLTDCFCAPKGGRARLNYPAGYVLKHGFDKDGYPRVVLRRNGNPKEHRVHILVCETFNGEKPSQYHEVAHGDGNTRNPAASNLRWATPKENMADRDHHGRTSRGSKHPWAKINAEDVAEIRSMIAAGHTPTIIAARYNVTTACIYCIKVGKSWGWLT